MINNIKDLEKQYETKKWVLQGHKYGTNALDQAQWPVEDRIHSGYLKARKVEGVYIVKDGELKDITKKFKVS